MKSATDSGNVKTFSVQVKVNNNPPTPDFNFYVLSVPSDDVRRATLKYGTSGLPVAILATKPDFSDAKLVRVKSGINKLKASRRGRLKSKIEFDNAGTIVGVTNSEGFEEVSELDRVKAVAKVLGITGIGVLSHFINVSSDEWVVSVPKGQTLRFNPALFYEFLRKNSRSMSFSNKFEYASLGHDTFIVFYNHANEVLGITGLVLEYGKHHSSDCEFVMF